jgi:hypothetical protein
MSAIGDCSCGCPTPAPVNIPGTPGLNGNPGATGAAGVDAFTITTQTINLPAVVGNNVTFPVANSIWMAIGQNIFISDGTNVGNFSVQSLPGITSVVLKWLGYTGDSPANTPIGAGATVSPAGIKGVSQIVLVSEINTGTVAFVPNVTSQFLFVECIGAGGSGGGVATAVTNAGAGGGGGGGAYSCIFLTGPLKASYTVSVGAGGAAPAAGANPGNSGADTTFDSPSVCTAKGGSGGGADTVAAGTARVAGAGGAGGLASGGLGDSTFDGNSGHHGLALAAAQAVSGKGSAGPLGGAPLSAVVQGNGAAGGKFGSGGSGGCILSGGASVAGGAGANGLIRVTQYT